MDKFDEILEKAKTKHSKGEINEAINLYKKIINSGYNDHHTSYLVGTAYLQLNNYKKAIFYLSLSIDFKKDAINSYNNRSVAYIKCNENVKALKDCNFVLKLNPNFVNSIINKGIALKNLKHFGKAIDCFNNSIKIDKNNFEIYNNLGNVFKDKGDLNKALKFYDKSISLNQNNPEAYYNKGTILHENKEYIDSIKNFEKALSLNKNANYLFGRINHAKMFLCDWKDYNNFTEKLIEGINNKTILIDPFILLSFVDDPTLQKTNAENYIDDNINNSLENKHVLKKTKKGKIKIGYYSADYHNHPVLFLMIDVFKNHNKSLFEIYAFSHGPNKNKNPWRDKVKSYFKNFFDVANKSDEEIVKLSKKVGIDVAVNLTGLTYNNRTNIYKMRVAPIQINYLGFAGTMGAKFIDYIIADKTVIPDAMKKNYTEKVLYLPNCYQPNSKEIFEINNKKNFSKKNLNLPNKGIIFCCFNSNYKITPTIFKSWMNILKKVSESVLWLYVDNETAKNNLRNEASKSGINSKRIIFAEKISVVHEHLQRTSFADIFLDTTPYNAHTTASDAIRVGLPIITLIGNSFASRVAASILHSAGMSNLIAETLDEYEKIAIELATNKERLLKTKQKIKAYNRNGPLFDCLNFTKNLENIYLKLDRERNQKI